MVQAMTPYSWLARAYIENKNMNFLGEIACIYFGGHLISVSSYIPQLLHETPRALVDLIRSDNQYSQAHSTQLSRELRSR